MKYKVNRAFLKSLGYLGSWVVIAILSSLTAVFIAGMFFIGMKELRAIFHCANPNESSGVLLVLFAVSGSVVAALISRIAPGSRGEGVPSYIRGVRDNEGLLSIKESVVKLFSSFVTLTSWGSGGFVGPLGRAVSGLTSSFFSLFRSVPGELSLRRTGAICGMAAVVGVITGAPVGSGIFAVEIIQKRNMRYSDLFPSVLSSSFAVFFSRFIGFNHFLKVNVVVASLKPEILPALLITSLFTALGGRGFELLYGGITRLLRRDSLKWVELRFAGATVVAVGLLYFVNPLILGTGSGFLQQLFDNPSLVSGGMMGAFILILARSLSVGLTVGSGQSAGFFAPLAQIGMLLGTFTAFLFGFAENPGNLHILQAAGLAGMLASALNVPLAAAVIVSEIFGPHLGIPAAIAAVLGFQINRHHTIYDNLDVRQGSEEKYL